MEIKGELFFSHGSEHSRGVLILIKNGLEFELVSVRPDKEERFIFLEALVQDQKFLFVNIYAPNKTSEQTLFFDQIKDELDKSDIDDGCKIIIGGDFKVILDPAQLISESYNNSHNSVKITLQGGVTIFGVNITPKRSYFFP